MRRRIVCAVRDETGWQVLECSRTWFGWRLGRRWAAGGASTADLLASVREYAAAGTALVIGLERARLVVRTAPRGALLDRVLPQGMDLLRWERPVQVDGAGGVELIACPLDHVAGILEEARRACFPAAAVFPVWAVAHRGVSAFRRGGALVWQGGGISMGRGGFGPWRDGSPGGEPASGTEASLRGGISYALSGFPRGWSSGKPRRSVINIPVAAALLGVVLWAGAYTHWIGRRVGEAERERAALERLIGETARQGCTTADIAAILWSASCLDGLTVDRVLYADGDLAVVGRSSQRSEIHALADSLRVGPDGLTIGPGDGDVPFRMEVELPCAR